MTYDMANKWSVELTCCWFWKNNCLSSIATVRVSCCTPRLINGESAFHQTHANVNTPLPTSHPVVQYRRRCACETEHHLAHVLVAVRAATDLPTNLSTKPI